MGGGCRGLWGGMGCGWLLCVIADLRSLLFGVCGLWFAIRGLVFVICCVLFVV